MARAFGSIATAEGVETAQQLAALVALGCDHVPGFLLTRPMPADQLTELLLGESHLIGRAALQRSDSQSNDRAKRLS
jgi:EAL domain-containing protein (putative c-di-GMP-specific phosphodiesterase class I)